MPATDTASHVRPFTIAELSTGQTFRATAAELRARFERDGVVVLPHFLAEHEMIPLRRELDLQYAPRAATAATTHNGVGVLAKFECDVLVWAPLKDRNAEFLTLNASPALHQVTEAAIGPNYTSSNTGLVMYSVGGGRGQAWHQDCPPGVAATRDFNLNRLFYTDDVALADGAIVFVPGSHRRGRIPAGGHQEPIPGEQALEPRAGTLVLLHGHVYHRVISNLNFKPRTSINLRAFPAGTPDTVTCIGVYRNGDINFCDTFKQHDGKPAEIAAK